MVRYSVHSFSTNPMVRENVNDASLERFEGSNAVDLSICGVYVEAAKMGVQL